MPRRKGRQAESSAFRSHEPTLRRLGPGRLPAAIPLISESGFGMSLWASEAENCQWTCTRSACRVRPRLRYFWFSAFRWVQPRVALRGIARQVAPVFLALATVSVATGQEALRYSLAGQDMAEARKRALENEKFSVNWGPVGLRFSANLGIDATDNVRLTEFNPQADMSFTPQVNTFARWRVTENNVLTATLGLGYTKYINATDYDKFLVTPDTAISFDIYAGDFLINLHDNFNYSADVANNPSVSGTGSMPVFQNMIGIRAVWDMNPFIIASYNHLDYITEQSGAFDNLTHSAELFTADIGYQWRPEMSFGLELAGGLMNYTQPLSQDNQHVSFGAFVKVRLSEYTSFRISGGYVMYFVDPLVLPNGVSFTNAASNFEAIYVDASLNQRVSSLLSHSLAFGHSLQPGLGNVFGSQLQQLWHINYSASWSIIRDTGVTTLFSYEQGTQGGTFGENYDRYGAGITFSRQLAKSTTGSIGYQFYLKDSDVRGRSYTQNRLVLSVAYAF